jgi:methionyl-tRNA formyltransferase
MTMKIAILTTETTHHAFFVRSVASMYSNVRTFVEGKRVTQSVSSNELSAFDCSVVDFETNYWFNGRSPLISDFTQVDCFESLNSESAVTSLKKFAPNVTLVFGTGILSPVVIETCSPNIFNLHGGDPELYRGLDSHLWAVYHEDFCSLITTLHFASHAVDSGRIVLQSDLPLRDCASLHQVRAINTAVCVQLSLSLLHLLKCFGSVAARPQRSKGRYYSAMPEALKEVCTQKFERRFIGQPT